MARFHGQSVSNTQAARAALTKSPQLLAWAFINYVVVSILRSIGNRGILGLLVGALLRAGWMLASFFVVPVILFEDKGALAAIKRSVQLCRSRWGENIVGNGALGVIGVVAILVDVVVSVVVGGGVRPPGGGRRRHRAGGHPVGADRGLGGVQRRPVLVCGDRPVPGAVLDG